MMRQAGNQSTPTGTHPLWQAASRRLDRPLKPGSGVCSLCLSSKAPAVLLENKADWSSWRCQGWTPSSPSVSRGAPVRGSAGVKTSREEPLGLPSDRRQHQSTRGWLPCSQGSQSRRSLSPVGRFADWRKPRTDAPQVQPCRRRPKRSRPNGG